MKKKSIESEMLHIRIEHVRGNGKSVNQSKICDILINIYREEISTILQADMGDL